MLIDPEAFSPVANSLNSISELKFAVADPIDKKKRKPQMATRRSYMIKMEFKDI